MSTKKIIIIGAGPSGSIAALYLAERGYNCTLIDKDTFPREKTCGDALGGYVVSVLNQVNPALLKDFMRTTKKIPITKAIFYSPSFRRLFFPTAIRSDINSPESFIFKRIDFDNFLVDRIRTNALIDFIEGERVSSVERREGSVVVNTNNGQCEYIGNLILFGTGGHKISGNTISSEAESNSQSVFGIRAYFKNVQWENDSDNIHLFFIKEILPGYLWVFPSSNGEANVGLATDIKRIQKNKIDLKKVFSESVDNYPELKNRLKNAEQITPWKGMKIPLGGNFSKISGENYLLMGDAASLANPLTGEGIGEAMYSGLFAAKTAIRSIGNNDFSSEFLEEYDKAVYAKLGRLNKFYAKALFWVSGTARARIMFRIFSLKRITAFFIKKIDKRNRGASR
jgi:menaquinone-9 beta-reductase